MTFRQAFLQANRVLREVGARQGNQSGVTIEGFEMQNQRRYM